MLTQEGFLESCRHETRVIQHLATKVPAGALDWRPTPAQRSVLDLLRYLTYCAILPAKAMVAGNWDDAEALEAQGAKETPATFSAAMDRQMTDLTSLLSGFSEAELASRDAAMPWGTPCKLGPGLVDVALKTLVAYRMQLFLYAKGAGNSAIGPANCWAGRDPAPARV
jgi:hypothetical protein